jgi:hypothetical protein
MENSEEKKIEQKVMTEIKSGRVKLRSKFIFLAEKLGIGSAFVLSALFAILFLTLIFFYLKSSDNLRYLSFGSRGFFAFLESFPYFLVIVFVVLILLTGFILKKSGFAYQKPFSRLALVLAGFIIVFGGLLTWAGIGERIERRALERRPIGNFFRPFLQQGFGERNNGFAGRVIKVEKENILLQAPWGEVEVDISKLDEKLSAEIKENDFVLVVGEKKDDVFEAQFLRVITGEEPPIMRHGIEQRFPKLQPPNGENFEPCPNCFPPHPSTGTYPGGNQ